MSNFMRLLVMFDMPVTNQKLRKIAANFRRFLLNDGYYMLQYSVYVRICSGNDAMDSHIHRLQSHIPEKGSIRLFKLTELQYENMLIMCGVKIPEIDKNYEKNRVIII